MIDEKHGGVEMTPEDRKIISFWIDAGANYIGTYAAEFPAESGIISKTSLSITSKRGLKRKR